MRRHLNLFILFFILMSILFVGCKKYPEGPTISLLSKTSRITNLWRFSSVAVNGVEQDLTKFMNLDGSVFRPPYSIQTVEFTKDGKVKWSCEDISWITPQIGGIYQGVWKFNKNKLSILLQIGNQTDWTEWIILKLKNKEFWYKEIIKNYIIETHLEPN